MLVFDGRYLFPVYPLVMAVSVASIVPSSQIALVGRLQRVGLASLIVAGVIFGLCYRSSPWRIVTRDFQQSCRDASIKLARQHVESVVTVGAGPYPEYGVGWEAGFIASFLSGSRVIAQSGSLPERSVLPSFLTDMRKVDPDALLIWGDAREKRYAEVEAFCLTSFPGARMGHIYDFDRGHVGAILYLRSR